MFYGLFLLHKKTKNYGPFFFVLFAKFIYLLKLKAHISNSESGLKHRTAFQPMNYLNFSSLENGEQIYRQYKMVG